MQLETKDGQVVVMAAGQFDRIMELTRSIERTGAEILRDRSKALGDFVAYAERKVAEIGPRPWMVRHLIDLLDDERRWLEDVALEDDPVEGRC